MKLQIEEERGTIQKNFNKQKTKNMLASIAYYQNEFNQFLNKKIQIKAPERLYQPISYILNSGGKRLRPVLTLMTAELYGTAYTKALDAALAIEIAHNFTLVHDDIMDKAPIRRGKATIHTKWNLNTAILSGDMMLVQAYQLFENYEGRTFKELFKLFNKTALQACEGQQYDIDFERQKKVSEKEYLTMIESKTAIGLATCMQMGAIVADASEMDINNLGLFGKNLGMAFQLQDDYLDAFGSASTFGKAIGKDIVENKKTYLYIKAMNNLPPKKAAQLKALYANNAAIQSENKVALVKELFIESGAPALLKNQVNTYTEAAFDIIPQLRIASGHKLVLKHLGQRLMKRVV